ncbi:hypothetical protein PIB30_104090 [Stylosanthes scabra]|uniref:Uncharacterized protein n=1 Tax=Stylosanthes scabra TaxID=79078 RepID=A0ABU6T0K5_9FABA|nr:hypothetical protein [Stylosanthes scabra]
MIKTRKCTLRLLELKKITTNAMINHTLKLMSPTFNNTNRTKLASMKIRQEQFFENMQKAQSQYLEERKSLRTRQDEMVNQQHNFYKQIKREQQKTIKEIEELKKF